MNGDLYAWLLWLSEGRNLESWIALSPERRSQTLCGCGLDEPALIEQIAAFTPADPASASLIQTLWTANASQEAARNALEQLLQDPALEALAHLAGGTGQRMSWPGQSLKHNLLERQERYDAENTATGNGTKEKEFFNENHILRCDDHIEISKDPSVQDKNSTSGYTAFQVTGHHWNNLLWGNYFGSLKTSRSYLSLVAHANIHGKQYNLEYIDNNGSAQLSWGTEYQHEKNFNQPTKASARSLLFTTLDQTISTNEKVRSRLLSHNKAYKNLIIKELSETGKKDVAATKKTQQTIQKDHDSAIDRVERFNTLIQALKASAIYTGYQADREFFHTIGVEKPMLSFLLAEQLSQGYFGVARSKIEHIKRIHSALKHETADLLRNEAAHVKAIKSSLDTLRQTYKAIFKGPKDIQQWWQQAQENNAFAKEKTKTGIHIDINTDPSVQDKYSTSGYTAFQVTGRDWNNLLWGNYFGSLKTSRSYLSLDAHANIHGKQYNLDFVNNNGSAQLTWGTDYQHEKSFILPSNSSIRSAFSQAVEKLNQRILENRLETKLEKKYEPALMKSLLGPGTDGRLLQLDLEINEINRRIKTRWAQAKRFTKNTEKTIDNQIIKPANSIKTNDQTNIREKIKTANSIINSPFLRFSRNSDLDSLNWRNVTLKKDFTELQELGGLRWAAINRPYETEASLFLNYKIHKEVLHIDSTLPEFAQKYLQLWWKNYDPNQRLDTRILLLLVSSIHKKPWKSFAEGGRFYYWQYIYNWGAAKTARKKGNKTVLNNYLKRFANTAANESEMLYRSEDQALLAARSTYQQSIAFGDSRKESLANADISYLSTLYGANRTLAAEAIQNIKEGLYIPHMGDKSQYYIWHADKFFTVGYNVLQRQVKISKKLWNDEHRRFGKLRAEVLLLKLTAEYAVSQQYEIWFSKHPYQQNHPVAKWFKGAWHDLLATVTLPYRAVKSEVKAWKSGEGFLKGLDAGWKTTTKTIKHDVRGINHTIKGVERLLGDIFSWLPGYKYMKDAVQVVNILGKSLEKLPDHLLKNFEILDKQVYKIISGHATWMGVEDGLLRDTKSFRRMLKHLNWLRKNRFHPKKLWDAVDHDVTEAKKVADIYFHKQEIIAAYRIKRQEYKFLKDLHQDSHGLVRSPIHILGKEWLKGHPKQNQNFIQHKKSFDKLILTLKDQLNAVLTAQINTYNSLSIVQKAKLDLKIASDYQTKTLRGVFQLYEYKQLVASGKVLDPNQVQIALMNESQKLKQELNKKAKHWVSDGGLVQWAIQVDKATIVDLHVLEKNGGDVCLAYELYKKVFQPFNKLQQRSRVISTDLGSFTHAVKRFRRNVNLQWKDWGHRYAKNGLSDYLLYMRPQFTITYNPTIINCKELTNKEIEPIEAKWSSRKAGRRAFSYLMFSYTIKNLGINESSEIINIAKTAKTALTIVNDNWDAIEERLWKQLIPPLHSMETAFDLANPLLQRLIIHALKEKKERFSATHKAFIHDAKYVRYNLVKVEDHARKAFVNEVDLLKILRLPVSDFNKTNYQAFESMRFSSIKLLELQAALSYDFTKSGKNDQSNFNRMIHYMSTNENHTVYDDLKMDKQIQTSDQQDGTSLTVGQGLVSIMPTSDDQQPEYPVFIQSTPLTIQSTPLTANLWMLYRNYRLIKHFGKKKAEKAVESDPKEAEQKAATDADENLNAEQKAKLDQIDKDLPLDDPEQALEEGLENNLEGVENDWSRETIRVDRRLTEDKRIAEDAVETLDDDLATETEDIVQESLLQLEEGTAELEGDFDNLIIETESDVETTIAEADTVIDETLGSIDEVIIGA